MLPQTPTAQGLGGARRTLNPKPSTLKIVFSSVPGAAWLSLLAAIKALG